MTHTRQTRLLVGLTVMLAATPPPVVAHAAKDDTVPELSSLSAQVRATGHYSCGRSNVAVTFETPTLLSIDLDGVTAAIGDGVPAADRRRLCNLWIGFAIPPTYAFRIVRNNFRGSLALTPGTRASLTHVNYVAGEATHPWRAQLPKGPSQQAFDISYDSETAWNGCRADVSRQFTTEISLTRDKPAQERSEIKLAAVNPADPKLKAVTFDLVWKRCDAVP